MEMILQRGNQGMRRWVWRLRDTRGSVDRSENDLSFFPYLLFRLKMISYLCTCFCSGAWVE